MPRPKPFQRIAVPPGLLLGRHRAEDVRPAFGFCSQPVGRCQRLGHPVVVPGDSHAVCIAPTGAGKTSGPAICNMLIHPGSAICLDPKGTIKAVAERHRKTMGHRIVMLDLREGHPTDSLNPVELVAVQP